MNSRGFSSGLFTNTQKGASGRGGDITVNTGAFRIADGAVVTAQTLNSSDGGNITINANTFTSAAGGQVLTGTFGSGKAGNIRLNATDSVTLSGSDSNFADRFTRFGRDVVANSGPASGLFANTDSSSTGSGGNVYVGTTNLNLINGSQISAQSQGTGSAGNINVNVRQTLSANNGSITAAANQAGGGNITLNARDLRLRNSSLINTNVAQGTGGGGNIRIDANTFVALEDSDILANANQGQGGNITINSAAFLADIFSSGRATPVRYTGDITPFRGNGRVDISASSAVGISGTVTIPDSSFIQNNLIQLPKNLIDPNTLLANSCIVRSSKQGGSFVITGAGGLPPRPGDASISPYPTGTVRAIPNSTASDRSNRTVPGTNQTHSWKLGDPIVEPQGVYRLADGQMVMSRECSH